MKFGKEEIQKMFLGGILLAVLVYVYATMLIGPVLAAQKAHKKATADIGPKITEAQKQIKRTAAMEVSAPQAAVRVKQITALIPDGSPVAWYPPRVSEFFKRHGVEKLDIGSKGATATTSTAATASTVEGFRQLSWDVQIAQAEFLPFATALAAWENEDWLTEVVQIDVEPLRDSPAYQRVALTFTNLVNQ